MAAAIAALPVLESNMPHQSLAAGRAPGGGWRRRRHLDGRMTCGDIDMGCSASPGHHCNCMHVYWKCCLRSSRHRNIAFRSNITIEVDTMCPITRRQVMTTGRSTVMLEKIARDMRGLLGS